MKDIGETTPKILAEKTKLNERYLKEWLSACAAQGYIKYDSNKQTFFLPPAHATCLLEEVLQFMTNAFLIKFNSWTLITVLHLACGK
jgi:hypothetical protein